MSPRSFEAPSERDLERAVADLERRVARKERPDRYDLRALLLALGSRPESPEEPPLEGFLARTRKAAAALGEAFARAAADELSLACAEHVHAVDPRYLNLPNYDFAYTLAARERLEWRLRAAAWLEVDPPENLLRAVAEADERLAPWLGAGDEGRGERD